MCGFSPTYVPLPKAKGEAIRAICKHESKYQIALQESYAMMSENTFKALRRQLPVTRARLDWLKLHSYCVAQDIKPQ